MGDSFFRQIVEICLICKQGSFLKNLHGTKTILVMKIVQYI